MRPEQAPLATRKFRPGENTRRPIGGHIAPLPFSQALYDLAKSRGYESQRDLTIALGGKGDGLVGSWYAGKRWPDRISLGNLITTLNPNPRELERILKLWTAYKDSGRKPRKIR